jgi:enamine deaminase RidA (YjgF/YER057c/UK114 family)
MIDREDLVPSGTEVQYEQFGYSPAVRAGELLYVSGVLGMQADGSIDPDPEKQFTQAFENLGHVLTSCGSSFGDVLEMTTFHVGLQSKITQFMAAKQAAMQGPPHPAWTAIGVVELALPGAIVEIRATARCAP